MHWEKIAKMEFDKCLNGSNASIEFVQGSELTQIVLAQETSGNGSKVQEALDELADLADNLKKLWALLSSDSFCRGLKHRAIQICDKDIFVLRCPSR